ncbi:peptidase M23 [Caloranaerobacter sp. TR13]|uniref:murein hydrolase activator EnvC family protein n=1 Tax=Caloranaerobacter sp. TR13 TaxID=1302151 RepID=UPI0006D9B5CA|nr:peptidoglycan DD-metalloendopeptidase family protein [Caloranaerobacter sp. TR13]KPU26984.1 peptidase M23 [Caloranaerobacter sp. TR13]
MNYRRKISFLLIIILLINVSFVYASSGNADKERKKLQEVNRGLDKLREELKQNKSKYSKVAREIKRLDQQIDKADKELQEVEKQLEEINKDIEVTKNELKQAENNIKAKKDILNSRLRVIYKNGTVGYLEVLLESKNISDFIARLDMVKRIIDYDVNILKYMKEQREIISTKKETLENQLNMVQNIKKKMEDKKNQLLVATRAKESMMKELKKNIKELEKQEDELVKLSKKLEAEIRKKQIAAKYAGGKMLWPAPGYYRITSYFGYRMHPILKKKKLHTGLDIAVPLGGKVVAANDGVVQYAGWLGGYGKAVWIDHGGGISTLYAHNSRLLVKKGQKVKKGQVISRAGSTGYSTGPHLHFEVRRNGKVINPLPWVKGK